MTDRVLCICGHAQDEHWRGTDGCKHSCACGKFRHASSNRVPCPDCRGKGLDGQDPGPGLMLPADECRRCNGTGLVDAIPNSVEAPATEPGNTSTLEASSRERSMRTVPAAAAPGHHTRNRVEPCPECGSRLDVHPSTCSRSVPGRLHAAPKHQAERWDCNLTLLGTHAEVEAWFIKLHDDYGDMIEGGFLGPEKDDE